MLFSFPVDALACNWLNPNVVDALVRGMDAIDARRQPEAWPDCLPDDRREILRRRTGLRPKLLAFWAAYAQLAPAERAGVREAIARQTALPAVLSDALPCPTSNNLPMGIRQCADVLADYLFGQLMKVAEDGKFLRDSHYEFIHNCGIRTCPFCGLYYFRPPAMRRNALDHLMPISRYPFVAADFRNLPPACHECNSTYKGNADILSEDSGARRVCSDPYNGPTFEVSLVGSALGAGNEIRGRRMPRWIISFLGGPAAQAETWNSVYGIKYRYEATLDADFLSWLQHFALWFVREFDKEYGPADVAQELPRYIDNVLQETYEDRAFLKAEALRLVERSCADPVVGHDTREWLWAFVEFSV